MHEKMHDDADRPRGILSKRDRYYLLNELDVEPQTQKERDIRADIRERMWNALLDFTLIHERVESRDLAQALGDEDDEPADKTTARVTGMRAMLAVLYELFTDTDYLDSETVELLGSGHPDLREAFEQAVEGGIYLVERERQQHELKESAALLSEPEVEVDVDITPPERIDFEQLGVKLRLALDSEYEQTFEQFTAGELLVVYWTLGQELDAEGDDRTLIEQWADAKWQPHEGLRESIAEKLRESIEVEVSELITSASVFSPDHENDDDE